MDYGEWTEPPKSQKEIDLENQRRNLAYHRRRVDDLDEKNICPCEIPYKGVSLKKLCRALDRVIRDHDTARTPYAKWSCQDLKAFARQRGLVLPKSRNKKALTRCLKEADSVRCFTFLDSPKELRMQVYRYALGVDTEKNLDTEKPESVALPALLKTCRQVREEATPTFYRVNTFVVYISTEMTERPEKHEWFSPPTKAWLQHIGSAGISCLQRIRFRDADSSDLIEIRIDLSRSVPTDWTIPFQDEGCTNNYFCKTNEIWSLAKWQSYHEANGHVETATVTSHCTALCDEALRGVREHCLHRGTVKLTLDSLRILGQVCFILMEKRRWYRPFEYSGPCT